MIQPLAHSSSSSKNDSGEVPLTPLVPYASLADRLGPRRSREPVPGPRTSGGLRVSVQRPTATATRMA